LIGRNDNPFCSGWARATMERTMETREVEPGGARSNVSLAERAYRIRRNALRMGAVQGQGYIAQALGVADMLAVAYFHTMRYRPDDPHWEERDRFLLSIGHYAIALYAVLIEAGILSEEEIETYGTDDSRLPMSGMAASGSSARSRRPSSTTCSPTASSARARPGRPRCRRRTGSWTT
jgi:hypothetical protein